jgi:TctA family transporter
MQTVFGVVGYIWVARREPAPLILGFILDR